MGIVKGSECLKIRQLIQMAEQCAWGHNFRQTVSKVLAVPAVGRKVIPHFSFILCRNVGIQGIESYGLVKKSCLQSRAHYTVPLSLGICNLIMWKLVLTMNGREITFVLIIVICFKMAKPFLLLCFSPAETRGDIMEKSLHGELVLRQARTQQPRGDTGKQMLT